LITKLCSICIKACAMCNQGFYLVIIKDEKISKVIYYQLKLVEIGIILNFLLISLFSSLQNICQLTAQLLYVLWPHIDLMMTSCWPHDDLKLTSRWLHDVNFELTSRWPHIDLTMTSCWPHDDLMMTSWWPHDDFTMTSRR
jgi:hypothetical protein